MASSTDLDNFVLRTRAQFDGKDWRATKDALPDNLAAIFAVWSVSASKAFYQESKNMETVLRPHPIQVRFFLLVLLIIFYKFAGINNPVHPGVRFSRRRDLVANDKGGTWGHFHRSKKH